MEVRLLVCLLLVWLPSYKAQWLSFKQGKVDKENQYFSNPQSNSEELDDYAFNDNINGDTTEDVLIDKRSIGGPENFFDDLEENIPLPDEVQQSILKEFSQASKDIPDAARYISDLMREEIGEIEEDISLPFSNMLFDEAPPDSEIITNNENYMTTKALKDKNYGSGEVDNQEELNNDEASTVADKRKYYGEGPRKEVKFDNGNAKSVRSGVKKKEPYSVSKAAVKGEKENPSEQNDDDDVLDSPVVLDKGTSHNSPVHSGMTSATANDLKELGNLVTGSKAGENKGKIRENNVGTMRKGNVSESTRSFSNPSDNVTYSMTQHDRYDEHEWNDKNQVNSEKYKKRSKRSKDIEDNKKDNGSKKRRVKVDDDDDDDDDIRLRKSGIFRNIADAFADIDKTKKESDRMEKMKKSMLEEAHETDRNHKPVNGGFTPWTDWSECSETCGNDSIKMRMRVCTNPPPSNGGKDCQGWRFEVKYCKLPGCKEQQEKVSVSNAKSGLAPQRKVIHQSARTPKASSPGVDNASKTEENLKQQRSKTNRIIEAMFKDVIHEAFDKSKGAKTNATNTNAYETKNTSIEIHKDSGLIASENEVDTIDDAPDTSQDMESEAEDNPSSQSMESEGQESPTSQTMEFDGQTNPPPKDENSQDQETHSTQNVESNGQPASPEKNMESEIKNIDSLDNMDFEDQSNMESEGQEVQSSQEEEEGPEDMETEGETNPSPQDMKLQGQENPSTSQDVQSQGKENSSSQDQDMDDEGDSESEESYTVQKGQSTQTEVKQSEESLSTPSASDTKITQSEDSKSSQDIDVKPSEQSQSSQETNSKQPQESRSSQETDVKQPQESQSSQETDVKQPQESQSSQETDVKQPQESQSSQDTNSKQPQESRSSQETDVKQPQESQSSLETNTKQSQESQSYQDSNVKQSEESESSLTTNAKTSEKIQSSRDTNIKLSDESQSSQESNHTKQSEESQSVQSAQSKQKMRNSSSKKSKEKIDYNSIDGNFDMVMKADDKDQNEKTEMDISKVAAEILKHNDVDVILKALSDNDTETLDSYNADAINAKSQNKDQDIHTKEKNEHEQEQGVHGNQTGNYNSTAATRVNEQANKPWSSDVAKSKNSSSNSSSDNSKAKSHVGKETDKDENSGSNHEKNKHENTLNETKQKTSKDQGELDLTINEQSDKLALDQASLGSQTKNYKGVQSIDWGNLHALNALVEVLAEHETNGTQNNTNTNQSQNDTTRAINNAAAIGKKMKSNDVTSVAQKSQALESASLAEKGDEKVNVNSNDDTKHDGGKRQNVRGEGNARRKENLTMPENPNAGPTAAHMANVSKKVNDRNDKSPKADTSVDTRQGPIKKKTNSTAQQDNLFNLLKEVVLSLQDTNDSSSTTKLDEIEKEKNMTKVKNKNNDSPLTPWSAWTTCSKSCGQGNKTRMRKCLLDNNNCKGPLSQTESCKVSDCLPVDGGFTQWSAWSSACSATCGEAVFKTRTRTCTNPVPQFGGKPCQGPSIDHQDCNLKPCVGFEIAGKIGNRTILLKTDSHPVEKGKGYWGQWSEWSTCTATCGGEGLSSRERSCLPGKQCKGPRYDTKECGTEPCPVDGGYTKWTAWSPCTPSCGLRAYRMRTRNCTNPPPSHGGRKCYDSAMETEPCKIVNCPIDGGYTSWSSWSSCTKTCGASAVSQRQRVCSRPEPRYGGRPCQGDSVQTRECGTRKPCPVNGGFTEWSSWTPCANVSCGSNLFSTRNRSCDNPRPQFGGKNCTGHLVEKKSCRPKGCPIDGGFSSWSAWSACPKNCKVSGVAHRSRTCDNPRPQNGGHDCIGPKIGTKACSNTCPVDGGFTEWTSWSNCSQECGHTSIKSRERYCTNPSPANGGKKCKGSRFQVKICRSDGCPVNGNYTAWSEWTACPRCGFGVQTRERTCTNPSPINGGKDCEGPAKEILACPFKMCRDDGFGQWSTYGHCSKSCGGGAKMRRRTCEEESKGCDGKFVQLKPCNQQSCVLGKDHIIDINPVSLCGFNPCKMSRCLGYPQAKCLTSSGCWPVFFDQRGTILELCKGDKTVFTSSPEMICHSDPCKVSGCYTDEAASCHVSLRCKPVFLDSADNKLDCRGLLNVPPSTVCGADPCEGSTCDLDKNARCIADYNCDPVFISAENEILSKCKVSKYRDNNYIINSKGGRNKQTNQDMENMKSKLQAFLSKSNSNNDRVETIAQYNRQQGPELTAEQQYDLADKLQNLKKRNRFYKPKKTSS